MARYITRKIGSYNGGTQTIRALLCKAKTKTGKPCMAIADKVTGYCAQHGRKASAKATPLVAEANGSPAESFASSLRDIVREVLYAELAAMFARRSS